MPFTVSHAAAALPFRRTRLPIAAVVIGSMSPDLLYFLELAPGGRFGHTLRGVVELDLPLSLVLFWLWKTHLGPFLEEITGSPVGTGVPEASGSALQTLLLAVAGIGAGIATHLVWDSFTHHGTWPVRHIRLLHTFMYLPGYGFLRGYELLQDISSVVGLLILSVWFWLSRRREERPWFDFRGHWRIWVPAAALFATAIGAVRARYGTQGLVDQSVRTLFAAEWVVTAMSVFFLLWLGAALAHGRLTVQHRATVR